MAMSRAAQSFAHKEEGMLADQAEAERRCQAAEARHEELAARLPEATRPLLRQIQAIQDQAAERQEAWNAVERSLASRCQVRDNVQFK